MTADSTAPVSPLQATQTAAASQQRTNSSRSDEPGSVGLTPPATIVAATVTTPRTASRLGFTPLTSQTSTSPPSTHCPPTEPAAVSSDGRPAKRASRREVTISHSPIRKMSSIDPGPDHRA